MGRQSGIPPESRPKTKNVKIKPPENTYRRLSYLVHLWLNVVMTILRAPCPEDLPALADLCTQLGYPSTTEEVKRRLKTILEQTGHAVFVAEVDGQAAGWIHVYASQTVESEPCAEIGGLVVDKTHRGQGLGRALLAEAEMWARQEGISEVRVRSNVIRREAHRFYGALGYENIKSQFTFRKQV
jgi:GNAT superfamily N-acetyltransferase